MKKLLILATISLAGTAYAAKWTPMSKGDDTSDPRYFNIFMPVPMNMSFNALPTAAKLRDERLAWSETFWPGKKGGVAYRWNDPTSLQFDKTKNMSEKELKK